MPARAANAGRGFLDLVEEDRAAVGHPGRLAQGVEHGSQSLRAQHQRIAISQKHPPRIRHPPPGQGDVLEHLTAPLDVLQTLARLFLERGSPEYLRSDNGPEMTSILIREWLDTLDVQTLFIEPGSP